MRKIISILFFVLPAIAVAGGDHHGDHGGHTMEHQHGSHDMKGMSHETHHGNSGRPGDPSRVTRTIEITMSDAMRFTPEQLSIKAGETVRFEVRNDGKIRHEMVIGSLSELKEHAEMMRANPTMQHNETNMITLAPNGHGDIVWQFDQPGTIDFACLVPGHLEAGMSGKIKVK